MIATRFFYALPHMCGFPIVVSGASWGDSQRTHTPLDSGEPAQETAVRKQPVTWRALHDSVCGGGHSTGRVSSCPLDSRQTPTPCLPAPWEAAYRRPPATLMRPSCRGTASGPHHGGVPVYTGQVAVRGQPTSPVYTCIPPVGDGSFKLRKASSCPKTADKPPDA